MTDAPASAAPASSALARIAGSGLPLRGDDVDTDRIIPARYLVSVTFEGLEQHVFEDDRKAAKETHPFDDPRFARAAILLVNGNFGCGSSREHAPQAIQRRGIRAVVGESFSEIFFGNAVALGMPCVTAPRDVVRSLQDLAEREPAAEFVLDLERLVLRAGGPEHAISLPGAIRDAFLTGQWDGTSLLLSRFDEVRARAAQLPYLSGFPAK